MNTRVHHGDSELDHWQWGTALSTVDLGLHTFTGKYM